MFDKSEFKNKLKRLALLDALLEPEWEYRYYSFNSRWGEGEETASLRDSCGGEWFILFFGDNVAFKCTSPVDGMAENFEEIKSSIPQEFASFLSEPAFSMDTGSCIWYLKDDVWEKVGVEVSDLPTPDTIQNMGAPDYCKYAEEIFETELDTDIVDSVLKGGFKLEMATKINPEINVENLKNDLIEIGINQ